MLRAHGIEATVARRGAQLCSLRKNDVPYLYEGDADGFWEKSAPLLFPAVGRSAKDRWILDSGREIPMPRHGFARDCDFEVLSVSQDQLVLELATTSKMLATYPFRFRLIARYQVTAAGLYSHYRVANAGQDLMPFSFGLHPAFRWPLDVAHAPRDSWHLRFPNPISAPRHEITAEGYRSGCMRPCLEGETHTLRDLDFLDDAIVIEGPEFQSVRLESAKSQLGVEVRFTRAPWIGFWTQPGAPFICVEPWWGVAARDGESGGIQAKDGIRWLKPGEADAFEMAVRLF